MSCNNSPKTTEDATKTETSEYDELDSESNAPIGRWRATLTLSDDNDLHLPFNFDLQKKGDDYEVIIINGPEKIVCKEVTVKDGEFSIKLPVFNSEIKGRFHPRRLLGAWHNYAKSEDYQLPFYAVHGDSSRFQEGYFNEIINVNGKWATMFFTKDKKNKTDAIAEFQQTDNQVTGTFLTATGDYRYLQGAVTDTSLMLSCFDGSHAFLFHGNLDEFGDLKGDFWSGSHWQEQWHAYRSDTVTLPNPEQLTLLKDGHDKLAFTFPDVTGKSVSLDDEKYKDKVVMVQILGTWCPNCMDETALYTDFYKKNKDKGLEIIGLAFENAEDLASAKPVLERYIQHFDIDYDVLFAGKASKKVASEALPMLTKILSFPTTIFIGRDGSVRKIHTGFSGPATSKYKAYVQELETFVDALLKEKIS